MNQFALRMFVRSLINEAKEKKADKEPKKKEAGLPKSSGKLVDLKKELAALKQMKEELMAAKFAEKTASTEVEFANLAKFAKELDKLKAGGAALEASIDNQIAALEEKISAEKNKIKEMIGLVPEAGQKKMVDEKKDEKLDELFGFDKAGSECQKKGKELYKSLRAQGKSDIEAGKAMNAFTDKCRAEKGLTPLVGGGTDSTKVGGMGQSGSSVVGEARFEKGTDIGKKGKGFEKIAKKAAKQYGSKEAGKKVAGAVLKNVMKEYETHYERINGVCYRINDEGERQRVSDYHCKMS